MESTESHESQSRTEKKNVVPTEYTITSKPSKVVQHHQTTIDHDGTTYSLDLVTMKRSFLLVINNVGLGELSMREVENDQMSQEEIIGCFMETNSSLRGLSLAIGEHSTCLIDSENSLASATLATRLSKKFNLNRPVYVANNLQISHGTIDSAGALSNIYVKIFQFVRANYKPEADVTQ